MKRILEIILITFAIILCNGCGANKKGESITENEKKFNYNITAPYYGKIKIGDNSINMVSTKDMLSENNMTWAMTSGADVYEDKNTKAKFSYGIISGDNYYSVKFNTYSNVFEDACGRAISSALSSYVELPKNITYNSTVDDVIKAYGEPKERRESNNKYCDGNLSATILEYQYKDNSAEMSLDLYFDKSSDKLYEISYKIRLNNEE